MAAVAEDLTLTGRLRARRVDLLRVGAGASPEELLRLARALSHDATPVPSTPRLRVEMAPVVVPGELVLAGRDASGAARDESDRRCWRDRRRWRPDPWLQPERRRGGDRRVTGERRLRVLKHYEADIGRLQDRLTLAVAGANWREALDAAHSLFLYAARVPAAERRSFMIGARRFVSRPAFAAFIGLGLKEPTEQGRVADVLRWSGLDGADAMIDAIRASPAVGPRKFLHRALAAMPEAYTTVLPLLASDEPHEVSHAASILGQMGHPEAVGALKAQLGHDDPDVRRAVLAALSMFPPHDVAETLGAALGHPSAATRAAARGRDWTCRRHRPGHATGRRARVGARYDGLACHDSGAWTAGLSRGMRRARSGSAGAAAPVRADRLYHGAPARGGARAR